MKWLSPLLAITTAAASLAITGCARTAPTATHTKAPATTSKAIEPTKAIAAPATSTKAPEPTAGGAAPVTKPYYPAKGKAVTLIVPWPAGGATDVGARVLAPALEKELGVPVQVVNKAGAASQVGLTELVRSKPDGYTIGYTNLPNSFGLYLDPDRKAAFSRKDFLPVALHISDPAMVAVKADSPYRTMKDLIDAAKTNPEKVKASTAGVMSFDHLNVLQTQKVAGVQFALVHFDGGGGPR